jgi:hypothetical protein
MVAHLSICILSREGPSYATALGISALLPSSDFGGERRAGWQASIKTLAIEDTDLDFRHVEPAGVVRGVVEDDASEQMSGRVDAEHVLESHPKMSIEVVENQMDTPRPRVDVFKQCLMKATKSILARRSVTSTVRLPPFGSTATNRLQVPARAYS